MSRLTVVPLALVLLGTACADAGRLTAPRPEPGAPNLERAGALPDKQILIFDRCDADSFNAVLGPGACVRTEPGLTFAQFIAQLEQMKVAPNWRFTPGQIDIKLGQSFVAVNHGGEVHTFTEVEEFGGGIVDQLNQLSGNPVPAPECLALADADFLPHGGTFRDTPDEVGTEKYQCCIHPWMRATVTIRGK